MKSRFSQNRRAGFTLVELLVSIAIIGVLAALILSVCSSVQQGAQATSCVSRLRSVGTAIALFAADHDDNLPTNGTVNPFDGGGYGRYFYLIGPYLSKDKDSAVNYRNLGNLHCPTVDRKPDINTTQIYVYTYNVLFGINDGNDGVNHDLPTPIKLARVARPNNTPIVWDTAGDVGSDSGNVFAPTPKAARYGYKGTMSVAGMAPNHGADCNILFVSGRVAPANVSSIENFPWNGKTPAKTGVNTVFDPLYSGS